MRKAPPKGGGLYNVVLFRGRTRGLLGHLLLLYLMVNDVTGGKLLVNVLQGNTHLDHQYHDVVCEIGDLVDGLLLVVCLARDDEKGMCAEIASSSLWQPPCGTLC